MFIISIFLIIYIMNINHIFKNHAENFFIKKIEKKNLYLSLKKINSHKLINL